jgi:5-methylcytosine-specific restriction endonuclease McrA
VGVVPIRPENRGRYPRNWPDISRAIRSRAGNVCETDGCGAVNGARHPTTGSKVVLTVAHLDHQPENCDPSNLRAWCQKCHNRYDAPFRRAGMKLRLRAELAAGDLL